MNVLEYINRFLVAWVFSIFFDNGTTLACSGQVKLAVVQLYFVLTFVLIRAVAIRAEYVADVNPQEYRLNRLESAIPRDDDLLLY